MGLIAELLNESVDPVDPVHEEVKEEDESHQFFFLTDIDDLTVAYDDIDADGRPVGLNSTLTTRAPGFGTLTVILRHEPDKSAEGVSDGDIANAGGDTDIEVAFPIEVQ